MISYLGDFAEDDTVYIMFNTFSSDDPSASCTITNFINTDVHIHKDDGLTQRNNAAGITVSVDFDGITGSHMVKIDTSDNTVAGFWVTGSDYFVRIEGTTIDGATVNSVIGQFSIENRFMRGTDSAALAATALTDATWTDAKAALIDHSIATVDTVADGIQTDLDNATDGLGALKALIDTVDGIVDNILLDTGTDGVLLAATATSAQLVDDMWDEILTGATHNIANSAGRRVREIGAFAIHSGTAQAGTSSSITLAATANGGDGVYNRNLIVLTDNTGVGQTRTIVDYDDTTKVVVIDRDWRVTPDNTTAYQIVPDDTPLVVDHGVAQAGSTSTTIKLRAYASAINDNYLCNIVTILAGTGRGQARLVGSYDGSTKVVTICGDNWVTTPDATSVYAMIPYGTSCTSCVGDSAQDQIVAAIIAGIADGSYDLQEMMRIMFAALSGKSSGGGTTTLTFRDSGDAKNRITATVNSSGDRTATTLDAT